MALNSFETHEVHMHVGNFCTRDVVVGVKEDSLYEAAKLMRQHHVGSLVVVAREDQGNRPIGILTDRDLVVGVIAEEIDINTLTIEDVMIRYPIVARENDDIHDTIESMRIKGVRRIPVVDDQGYLTGIVTTDDILDVLSTQLNGLAILTQQERKTEFRTRPAK